MIKITTTSKEFAAKAEKVMSHEVMYNVNLNGAEYEIEVGDYNEIDIKDQYLGTTLYNLIFNANEE